METSKAHLRRLRSKFFGKYCQGLGIDIGCGKDPITPNCVQWDRQDGDAHFMQNVDDNTYDFVYSSHCLEHLSNPGLALVNWFRILKPGGYLILFLPHRDLYEKRTTLPSKFNRGHYHYYLIDRHEPPCTLGIVPLIAMHLQNYRFIYTKECSEGHTITDPEIHSDGEYSIELALQKF